MSTIKLMAHLKKHVPELLKKITRFTYNLLNRLLEDIQFVFLHGFFNKYKSRVSLQEGKYY